MPKRALLSIGFASIPSAHLGDGLPTHMCEVRLAFLGIAVCPVGIQSTSSLSVWSTRYLVNFFLGFGTAADDVGARSPRKRIRDLHWD
jgi:hypothetical protein